jgi:trigger factor
MVFTASACSKESLTEGTGSTEDAGDFTLSSVKEYVTVGDYKGVEVTEISDDSLKVTDEEVEERIKAIINEYAEPEQIKEGEVKDGDTVNIDFEGKMNGEVFEGGTAENQTLAIGSNSFIDGFEEGLIGKKVGDTVTLNLKFPDEYPRSPENAGKPVDFTVKINYIEGDPVVPELNDEFAKTYSEEYATVADLRVGIRAELEASKKESAESTRMNEAWKKVSDAAEVKEYPEDIYQEYYDTQYEQYETYATSYGFDTLEAYIEESGSTMEEFEASLKEYAEMSVKNELAFRLIAEKEGIEITEEAYKEAIEEYAEQYGYEDSESFVTQVGKSNIVKQMLWEKVIEVILDNAVDVKATSAPTTEAATQAATEAATQ